MAIPVFKPREEYIGTGLVSSYTFDFKVISKDQILIIHTDDDGEIVWAVRGNDISVLSTVVLGPSADGGGTVNLVSPLPIGHNLIIIQSDYLPTQPKRMSEKTGWQLKDMENALDYLGVEIQSIAYRLGRALLLSETVLSSANFDPTVPPPELDSILIAVGAPTPTHFEWIHRDAFKGEKGDQGDPGEAATIAVGTVGEIDYTDPTPMSVYNSGTTQAAIFDFVLRSGPEGPEGPEGPAGASTVLITVEDTLPDNLIGNDGDVWIFILNGDPNSGNFYQKESGVYVLKGNIIGPAGGVNSFNTRIGNVTAQAGDYVAVEIDFMPTSEILSTDVQSAIEEVQANVMNVGDIVDDIISVPTGGTTGQILGKTSNLDGAIAWQNPPVTSPLTTKGDVYGHDGSTGVRIPVGTNGQLLTADSTVAAGVAFKDAPVSLPAQTGNAGKILGTDGTTAAWEDKPKTVVSATQTIADGGTITRTGGRVERVKVQASASTRATVTVAALPTPLDGDQLFIQGMSNTAPIVVGPFEDLVAGQIAHLMYDLATTTWVKVGGV